MIGTRDLLSIFKRALHCSRVSCETPAKCFIASVKRPSILKTPRLPSDMLIDCDRSEFVSKNQAGIQSVEVSKTRQQDTSMDMSQSLQRWYCSKPDPACTLKVG